ncbi:hypothetical protein FGB62_22g711 [Gracilaria domingensis]|nr:hypothetical protein FGB62_22g711 [Gracilaria domingensis]
MPAGGGSGRVGSESRRGRHATLSFRADTDTDETGSALGGAAESGGAQPMDSTDVGEEIHPIDMSAPPPAFHAYVRLFLVLRDALANSDGGPDRPRDVGLEG